MNKKYIIWIGSVLVVGGLGYLAYDFWKKKQKDEEAPPAPPVTPEKDVKVVAPIGKSDFPLKKGVRNETVKELQLALGIPETTFGFGYFGNQTLSKLKLYYGKESIANANEFKFAKVRIAKAIDIMNKTQKTLLDKALEFNTRPAIGTQITSGTQFGVQRGNVGGNEVSMRNF